MNEELLRRVGISEVTTPMWTLPEDAAGYAAAGFGAIGIWLHKLERPRLDSGFFFPEQTIPQQDIDAAVSAVRSAGIPVSDLVLAGMFTDDETRGRMIEHALHAVGIAAAFDASYLVVNPGRLNGRTRDDAMTVAARALTEVLERRSSPVRLALEPVVDWQSDFLNTLGQALDLVDLVDHPDLGVLPDTYALWETGTYYEDIERAGSRIAGFHLNDAVSGERPRRIPGEGEAPLVEMIRAVNATGYRGTYDVEYMFPFALVADDPGSYAPDALLGRIAANTTALLAEAGVAASPGA